jgi:hypothetical protein
MHFSRFGHENILKYEVALKFREFTLGVKTKFAYIYLIMAVNAKNMQNIIIFPEIGHIIIKIPGLYAFFLPIQRL